MSTVLNKKLGVRDLIYVGIFAAIYSVMFTISGMSSMIPIMQRQRINLLKLNLN